MTQVWTKRSVWDTSGMCVCVCESSQDVGVWDHRSVCAVRLTNGSTGELGFCASHKERWGVVVFHPDVYLLTVERAAERWSSRPECRWLARCQEPVLGQGGGLGPGQELVLR